MRARGEQQTWDPTRLGQLARRALPGNVPDDLHVAGRELLVQKLARPAAPRRPAARWLLLAACFALIPLAVLLWPRPGIRFQIEGGSVLAANYVQVPAGAARATIKFSDGSVVDLDGGARGRVLNPTSHGASLLLEEGSAMVRVVPRKEARWQVEAGPFVVDVTGTRFRVQWSSGEEKLDVQLFEGHVNIRGPLGREPIALEAGQHYVARVGDGSLSIAPIAERAAHVDGPSPLASTEPAHDLSDADVDGLSTALQPCVPVPVSWSKRIAAGEFRSVLEEAEARGIDSCMSQCSLADMVALGDAARYAGRTGLAKQSLMAQRQRFGGSSAATSAAFLLGRIAQDNEHSATAAVQWYDIYLREAPGGAFAAEALGRKMGVVAASSGAAAARPIAEAYLKRYPNGPHAASARKLVGPP